MYGLIPLLMFFSASKAEELPDILNYFSTANEENIKNKPVENKYANNPFASIDWEAPGNSKTHSACPRLFFPHSILLVFKKLVYFARTIAEP